MKKTIATSRWSAQLNTDVCDPYTNANLTLVLRLGFRQINPAAGAASGTYHDYGDPTAPTRKIVKWTTPAWHTWTRNLCASAQRFWDGRYWLLNNFATLDFTNKSATYRPNVHCRIQIVRVLENGHHPSHGHAGHINANHVIDVVRLDPTETWFGSHSTLYDSLDTNAVQKATDSAGHPIMQRAHVHEIGHLLGLAHIDVGKAHCPVTGNTNASACYGVADADMQTVMGDGMTMRPAFATPWRRAVVQLTSMGHVATTTDWQAKMRRQFPRTPAEALLKQEITVRPVRA